MKAVLKTEWEPGIIEIKDVDKPKIGADEVLIEVMATGICGSDVEIYEASMPLPVSLPRIMGHEFSGVVVEVGEAVLGVRVDDRVVAESGIVCRRCRFCKMGRHNLCLQRKILGYLWDGTFAEYVKVPGINVHKVPDNVPLDEAALAEPTAVTVHAVVERAHIMAGDVVAILGPGPIGLLTLQCAKSAGARRIIVTGLSADRSRLELARKLGADETINVEEEDAVKKTKELTDAFGADVVFEATGAPPAVKQAIDLTRKGGKIVLMGLHTKPVEKFDATHIIVNEKNILSSFAHASQTWDRALSLISDGKIKPRPLITHVLPLEQIEQGFHLVKKKEAIKVVIKPP